MSSTFLDYPYYSESSDYYETLQVGRNASPEIIETAYRQLARIYHPDRNVEADTTAQMQAINVAYCILRDPQKRTEYDMVLAQNARAAEMEWATLDWNTLSRFRLSWSSLHGHTKLSVACVVLSVVCLLGIANNLLAHHTAAVTHAAVNATVVAMQMEQSIEATVVAVAAAVETTGTVNQPSSVTAALAARIADQAASEAASEAVADDALSTDLAAEGGIAENDVIEIAVVEIAAPQSRSMVATAGGIVKEVDRTQNELLIAPYTQRLAKRPLAHPYSIMHRTLMLSAEVESSAAINAPNASSSQFFEPGRSLWGLIQVETHPYYHRLNLLLHDLRSKIY